MRLAGWVEYEARFLARPPFGKPIAAVLLHICPACLITLAERVSRLCMQSVDRRDGPAHDAEALAAAERRLAKEPQP